ncbi:hypothetical protein Q5P01_019192 [Channa striata]|uniref:Adhesion G-protein coupled receptor G4-like n=1 Tax=Channa striata TaxID=64152 RepID=A0AA88M1Y2_CHASR|nr:hypothetical protein Q5P01_019192 [Channa striata]
MIFLQTFRRVFVSLFLLSSAVSLGEQVPQHSLWGKVGSFGSSCSHWSLQRRVSIPALQQLTVSLNIKFDKTGHLVVWLFGQEWTTEISVVPSQWYSLCLTWSHVKDTPALYVNGNLPTVSTLLPRFRPRAANWPPTEHLHWVPRTPCRTAKSWACPFTSMSGKLSLFRLWGRERSKQEVTSLNCTEGDLVAWETGNWDTQICPPLSDPSLKCDWSVFEVKLTFAIIRHDGNNTELYKARDKAHRWLEKVLPAGMYLHKLSVFEVTRSSEEDGLVKASDEDMPEERAIPNINRYTGRVYVNVIPSMDVATVQEKIYTNLVAPHAEPDDLLRLLADGNSIYITPVKKFPTPTTSPSTITPDVVTKPFPVTTTSPPSTSFSATTTTDPPTSEATATTFTASPANVSELFFEVKINVSITGDYEAEQILSTWLNSSLPDNMMTVLDLQLIPKSRRHPRHQPTTDGVSKRKALSDIFNLISCVFQVQVMTLPSDTQQMENQIRDLLLQPFNNGSISIKTEDIQITRIMILNCNAETHQTRKGLFEWTTTTGGKNATQPCPKNPQQYATRHCRLCLSTHWMDPDLEACALVVQTIPDLDDVNVTAENALDVVEMIEGLLNDHSTFNYEELVTVLRKLKDIVTLSVVTPSLGQALVNVISDILKSDSYLVPFTNTILNITDTVGNKMVGYEGAYTLVAPAIGISVVDVVPGQFSSLTFGVLSDSTAQNPEIFINRYPFNSTVAFIDLPSVLQNYYPQKSLSQNLPRVQFQFYGMPLLFKSSQKGQTLNTFVVSASVTNASSPIKNLNEYVKVMLQHIIPNTPYKDVQCVYWNFNKNDGHGGWDDYGCRKYNSSSDYTTCLCDHLTHFGVLLDVSRTQLDPANEQILTIITYLGCGVSSLFLGITVLTYTVFEKLRRDYPSQILINLSLALLGLNLVFLVNSWVSSWDVYGLCVTVASMMHYFLLASFTWMGLEAVNMYLALVKVFNVYVPSYILKFCVLGWGLPLVICILVLIVNRDAYGNHLYTDFQPSLGSLDNSDSFCWLQDNVTFYVSVVAYAVLVFIFNTAVFVVVLIQIRHMRVNSPAGTPSGLMHDLKGVASLTLLLGLTWTIGFFTWGPARVVLLYLFSGLNTLQGLFIFLFHCLMKENVRKQWRIHICIGRFRLDEYSEWSNSASVGIVAKPRSHPPAPSIRSVKSSSTESTSASSDSSQRDSSCKRPNLGLFVNSLALPRAQRCPSGTAALPSQRGTNPTPGRRNDSQGRREQR